MRKQLHLKKTATMYKSVRLILLIVAMSFYGTFIVKACDPVPVADFTASSFTVTEGSSLNFTDLSTAPAGDPVTKWKWIFEGASPGSDTVNQNPTGITYTISVANPCAPATQLAKLACSNNAGSSPWTSYNITVVSKKPRSNFSADNTSPTSGTIVNFTDLSSQTPTVWAWSISPAAGWSWAGGTNASTKNPKVTFTTVGCYTVSLTASNGFGAGCPETKACYINTISCKPVGNFVASTPSIAQGGIITFTDLSTQTPTGWTWVVSPMTGISYQGGTSAASQNPQIKFNTGGTYTVTLTPSNGCGAGFAYSQVFSISTKYTWVGGASAAWNNSANWNPVGVPGYNGTTGNSLDEVIFLM